MSRKCFKIISIIFTIQGAANLICNIPKLVFPTHSAGFGLTAACVLCGALTLALGILGLKALEKTAKASLCMKLDLALIIASILQTVAACLNPVTLSGIVYDMTPGLIVASVIISLILPVLYMVCARKLAR